MLGGGQVDAYAALLQPTFIELESLNGGDSLLVGTMWSIYWQGARIHGDIRIELNRNYPSGAWETIVAAAPDTGRLDWTISAPITSNARIRLLAPAAAPVAGDTSVGSFVIMMPYLIMTRPLPGDALVIGARRAIAWTTNGVLDTVQVELDRNYPSGNWEAVSNVVLRNNLLWTVTGPTTDHARVRARWRAFPAIGDTCDGDFRIIEGSAAPEPITTLPTQFAIESVSPNPFNLSTTITIAVPRASHIRVDIVNVLGQRAATLFEGDVQAGRQRLRWQPANMASGKYIVRMESDGGTFVRELQLLK